MLRGLSSIVWRFVRQTAVLLALVLVLFPAAELVSAAGESVPQRVILAQTGSCHSDTTLLPPDGDFCVYLPLVVRRWPPVPYALILSPIAGPVIDAPYTLSWSADLSREVTSFLFYEIEESTAPDFTHTTVYTAPFVYTSTLVMQTYVVTKPVGTVGMYYYRVRAYNSWGAGSWSNVASVFLTTRLDNFTNPLTGWAARRTSSPDINLIRAAYTEEGWLDTVVHDRFDFAIFSPMYPAPPTPYSIHLRTKILHVANEVSYGIVFGGNQGTVCQIQRENAADPAGCFSHYYRLNNVSGGTYWKFNVSRVDYHGDRGKGVSTNLSDWYYFSDAVVDPESWLNWQIRVSESGFAVYLNGLHIVSIADTRYLQDLYYGIFSSTYEYNNAHFIHEYFYVVPIAETSRLTLDTEAIDTSYLTIDKEVIVPFVDPLTILR